MSARLFPDSFFHENFYKAFWEVPDASLRAFGWQTRCEWLSNVVIILLCCHAFRSEELWALVQKTLSSLDTSSNPKYCNLFHKLWQVIWHHKYSLSSDYIELTFSHKCKFPSLKLVRIHHEIHSFTTTLINTSIMMQLFPVNYITADFINFCHLYSSLHSSSTHHQPAKHWDVLFKAPMGACQPSSPITPENIAGF